MRRADRLFEIIQVLRRSSRPLTAAQIAEQVETSQRTVYRDIAALIGQRVPIRGEAGIGYVLDRGFDLPPLMLTPDEIEAVVLGAELVKAHAAQSELHVAASLSGQGYKGPLLRIKSALRTRGLFPTIPSSTNVAKPFKVFKTTSLILR